MPLRFDMRVCRVPSGVLHISQETEYFVVVRFYDPVRAVVDLMLCTAPSMVLHTGQVFPESLYASAGHVNVVLCL